MSSSTKQQLVLDHHAQKEIVREIWRMFMLHTGHISFHFDSYGINIMIHADEKPFVLPHGPVDVRTDGQTFESFNQVP